MTNWIMPENNVDAMMKAFSKACREAELTDPDFFPDLRNNSDLVLASDYAGDHKESDYQVAAFLLTNRLGIMDAWEPERLAIRQRYLPDNRRIAFKRLSDAARQKALGPFLSATAKMNGIVFCAAIDKSLATSNFGYQITEVQGAKPLVLAKATRIAALGSVLVGGLSTVGQNLKWITDDDEIASNDSVAQDFGRAVGWLLHRNAHGMEGMIGIAGKFEDNLRAEDLCSIPDLVGGAIAESMNALDKDVIPRTSNLFTYTSKRLSTKSRLVFGWFSTLGKGALKRLFCLIRPHESGGVLLSFSNPTMLTNDHVIKSLILPPDKGWRDSVRHWRLFR